MPQNLKRLSRVLCCSNCLQTARWLRSVIFIFIYFVSLRGQNNSRFAVFLSLFPEKEIVGNYSRFRDIPRGKEASIYNIWPIPIVQIDPPMLLLFFVLWHLYYTNTAALREIFLVQYCKYQYCALTKLTEHKAQEVYGNRMHLMTLGFQSHRRKLLRPNPNQTSLPSSFCLRYYHIPPILCSDTKHPVSSKHLSEVMKRTLWNSSQQLEIQFKEGKGRVGRGRQPKTAKSTEDAITKEAHKNQNITN